MKSLKALLAFPTLLYLCSPAQAVPLTNLFNTGISNNRPDGTPALVLPDAAVDPHYVLNPSSAAFVTIENGFPVGPNWLADDSTSKWVSPNANENSFQGGSSEPTGTYTYRISFDLTGFAPESASITGQWAADDQGTDILVNGVSTGLNAVGYGAWSSFEINTNFISGLNTLDFVVFNKPPTQPNAANPSGLRVELTGTACPSNSYTPYAQYGTVSGVVPSQFGPGNSPTSSYGCALCSVATMLTQFGISITPYSLNTLLINANAFSVSDGLFFDRIAVAVSSRISINELSLNADSSSYNDAIAYWFCDQGAKVILQLNEWVNGVKKNGFHYIVVTGSDGNDWYVFDPGWANAPTTLSGHLAGFTDNSGNARKFSVNGYRIFQKGNQSSFSVDAQSPVELLVADPVGQLVGFDPTNGTNYAEITGAFYSQDDPLVDAVANGPSGGDPNGIKSVYIPAPLPGAYTVLATGTSNGTYTINLQASGPAVVNQSASFSGTASVGVQFTNYFTVVLPPQITLIRLSDANLIINGINGLSGSTYLLLMSTNLELPLNQWTPVATNILGTNGNFSIIATNAVDYAALQRFYILRKQ